MNGGLIERCVVDVDGVPNAMAVCAACIRLDPAQLSELLQQRSQQAAGGA
jgi:hypothetical protein